ncbi:MAG: hypothetical protein ABEJ07_01530 [Candidatus Nanohaloarchaea archaeon]
MENSHSITAASLVLGSILAAAGFTLVGISSFAGEPLMAASGFLSFVLGYKISWYGTHTIRTMEELRNEMEGARNQFFGHVERNLGNYALITLGLGMAAHGTTLFAQVITRFQTPEAVLSGLLCTTGYMLAHEGVNEVLI